MVQEKKVLHLHVENTTALGAVLRRAAIEWPQHWIERQT